METFVCTAGEFAVANGVEYAVANGVLRFLKDRGVVTEAGSRPAKGGKGKPSTLYNVPYTVSLTFKVAA